MIPVLLVQGNLCGVRRLDAVLDHLSSGLARKPALPHPGMTCRRHPWSPKP